MGYTHYFEGKITKEQFNKVVEDMKVIEEEYDGVLYDGRGEKKGVVYGDKHFAFNGCAKNGLDHETFWVEYNSSEKFNFCKTARKPYDVAVVACLLSIIHHCPNMQVSSDGDMHGEDWKLGKELYKKCFSDRVIIDDEEVIIV